jgi:hypothetical protein
LKKESVQFSSLEDTGTMSEDDTRTLNRLRDALPIVEALTLFLTGAVSTSGWTEGLKADIKTDFSSVLSFAPTHMYITRFNVVDICTKVLRGDRERLLAMVMVMNTLALDSSGLNFDVDADVFGFYEEIEAIMSNTKKRATLENSTTMYYCAKRHTREQKIALAAWQMFGWYGEGDNKFAHYVASQQITGIGFLSGIELVESGMSYEDYNEALDKILDDEYLDTAAVYLILAEYIKE